MRSCSVLLAVLLAAPAAFGQGSQPAPKKPDATKPKPLPAGQKKMLQALVIEVKGVAQARSKPGEKWAKLKVNDMLAPGTVMRTGRKSRVVLRIGVNGSLLVDRQSRVAIPEIAQEGAVLKTRVSMSFGKADVRVDKVGLRNDFEVATPTATLAVRGTTLRLTWTAVHAFQAEGIPGNELRAAEVSYLNGAQAFISEADVTTQQFVVSAFHTFQSTYVAPLPGAIGPSEFTGVNTSGPGFYEDPVRATGIKNEQTAPVSPKSGTIGGNQ